MYPEHPLSKVFSNLAKAIEEANAGLQQLEASIAQSDSLPDDKEEE